MLHGSVLFGIGAGHASSFDVLLMILSFTKSCLTQRRLLVLIPEKKVTELSHGTQLNCTCRLKMVMALSISFWIVSFFRYYQYISIKVTFLIVHTSETGSWLAFGFNDQLRSGTNHFNSYSLREFRVD